MTSTSPEEKKFQLYHYAPSVAAAVLFIVLFGLSASLHIYQVVRTRTWFFIAFCVGGLCEVVGYVGRAVSASQTRGDWTLGPYIVQSVLPLVAPALFAASTYQELGRIVELVDGDDRLFIRRRWLTGIFVSGDVLSFLMQASGGGLLSSKMTSSREMGEKIIVGGLFLQIIFFGIFVLAAAIFHIRIVKRPTSRSANMPWQKHLLALYATSLLILIRSIFRATEFLQGFDGFLLSHEVFIYVFDAALMWIAMVILNVIHPSEIKSLLHGGKSAHGLKMQSMDSRV